MKPVFRISLMLLVLVLLLAEINPAHAYGGPGSVISGIGALLAALAVLLASLFGFLWFPLKRLYRRMSGGSERSETVTEGPSEE